MNKRILGVIPTVIMVVMSVISASAFSMSLGTYSLNGNRSVYTEEFAANKGQTIRTYLTIKETVEPNTSALNLRDVIVRHRLGWAKTYPEISPWSTTQKIANSTGKTVTYTFFTSRSEIADDTAVYFYDCRVKANTSSKITHTFTVKVDLP